MDLGKISPKRSRKEVVKNTRAVLLIKDENTTTARDEQATIMILLPTSVEVRIRSSVFSGLEKGRPLSSCCEINNFNRLAKTNAVSLPEKNALRISVKTNRIV